MADQPDQLEAEFRLESVTGVAGSDVAVPFLIRSNGEAAGFSFSIDFDEGVLTGTNVEQRFRRSIPWDFWKVEIDNTNDTPGSGCVDEGYVTGAGVFSFISPECATLPAHVDTEVVALNFSIDPDTEVGATEVRDLRPFRGAAAGTKRGG